MNTKEAIQAAMDMSQFVLGSYISDLSDEELMRRPAAGCNHLAWQLGHLISSEVSLVNSVCPGKGGELPAGFAEKHGKENAASDNRADFCSRREYEELFQKVRVATKAALAELPEADLDKASPEWIRNKFPTLGHFFLLIGNHPMMHAGQFVVVRRQLDKPVLI